MPFGLQVIGRFRGDRQLLGTSHALEHAFDAIPALRRPRPDVGNIPVAVPALTSIVTHAPSSADSLTAGSAASR
jgi:hypothetical protein